MADGVTREHSRGGVRGIAAQLAWSRSPDFKQPPPRLPPWLTGATRNAFARLGKQKLARVMKLLKGPSLAPLRLEGGTMSIRLPSPCRTTFADRLAAGRALAAPLSHYTGRRDVLVLALARGGVPVGFELARALEVPLDVLVARKLGAPFEPELAIGAITRDARVVNYAVLAELGIEPATVEELEREERLELERREQAYRRGRPPPRLADRVVILVDDGLATGATMFAAVRGARTRGASRVVVAAPVGSRQAARRIGREVDELVVLAMPEPMRGVGSAYDDFHQLEDDEVVHLLDRAWARFDVGERVRAAPGAAPALGPAAKR